MRGCCVGSNENQREMKEELYWLNGFSFYLIEKDATKVKTFLELEFIEEENRLGQVLMKMTIKSDLNDLNYFYSSLHQTIQIFVEEWIVREFCNKINIKITKKKQNTEIFKTQSCFLISENFNLNDKIEQFSSVSNNVSKRIPNIDDIDNLIEEENQVDKFKCFNCGFTISLLDLKDNTCDKCKQLIF